MLGSIARFFKLSSTYSFSLKALCNNVTKIRAVYQINGNWNRDIYARWLKLELIKAYEWTMRPLIATVLSFHCLLRAMCTLECNGFLSRCTRYFYCTIPELAKVKLPFRRSFQSKQTNSIFDLLEQHFMCS